MSPADCLSLPGLLRATLENMALLQQLPVDEGQLGVARLMRLSRVVDKWKEVPWSRL
jgi:hypothetical protein